MRLNLMSQKEDRKICLHAILCLRARCFVRAISLFTALSVATFAGALMWPAVADAPHGFTMAHLPQVTVNTYLHNPRWRGRHKA